MRVHTRVLVIAVLGALSLGARAQSSESMRDVGQIWRMLNDNFIYSVPEEELRRHAIDGLLSVDPHAGYYNDAEFTELTKGITQTSFGGIGVEILKREGKVVVVTPIDGTPAAAAGLRSNDVITRINDENPAPKSLLEVTKMIRGPIGSEVRLLVQREGEPKPREVRVSRQTIHVASVVSKVVGQNIGYLRIRTFQSEAPEALAHQLADLLKSRPRGLIVDVRSNPGGLLTAALQVASLFLPERTLVIRTEGRRADSKQSYYVDDAPLRRFASSELLAASRALPLAVLVDGGTASSSEMLVASLQDNKRATVYGVNTFGKGALQSIIPLGQGKGAVKVTISTFITPGGKPIEGLGIMPAVTVENQLAPADFGGDKDVVLSTAMQALLR
jgi:carboxyl-terminal processing protease